VDIELNLRAKALGFQCYGAYSARMSQSLGYAIATLFTFITVPPYAPTGMQ
jgi:hypothetical protein